VLRIALLIGDQQQDVRRSRDARILFRAANGQRARQDSNL
jgi:hypothetical protein